MILENGVIRTLDPSLPESRALAIAGDRIAGGVGVHETALASPETIDLGGRCVLPGFTDSHVHFPTWAVAQHEIKLDGFRMAARIERGRTKLLTRTGLDWTDRYPAMQTPLTAVRAKTAYLDGELCGVGADGLPSFSETQAATDGERGARLVFYASTAATRHAPRAQSAARAYRVRHSRPSIQRS